MSPGLAALQADGLDLGGVDARQMTADDMQGIVQDLVNTAAFMGLVITVEQVPLLPLAMGHHRSVVTVRPARELQC